MDRRGFWAACERLSGPAAVELQWRQLAGDEYDAAKVLLRPMQELASYYPCTRSYPCGCYHRVVVHSDDDIVAVCTCDPQMCERVHITKSDIIVYELDRPALHKTIVDALSIEPKEAQVPYLKGTTHVGVYSPHVGCNLPVYLAIRMEPHDFQHIVFSLAANSQEPFVLIAPTGNLCEPDCLELLEQKDSLFLVLSDLLIFNDGAVIVNVECVEAFAEFCARKMRIADHKSCATKPAAIRHISENVFRQENNFRTVWFHGKQLESLSKGQAEIIKVLYEAAQQGRPEVLFAAISVRMTEPTGKISNVFRRSDSRSILVRHVKKDIYRLNL